MAEKCSVPNCDEIAVAILRAQPSGIKPDEQRDFPFCGAHAQEYEALGYAPLSGQRGLL